jgi:hypothetical protein
VTTCVIGPGVRFWRAGAGCPVLLRAVVRNRAYRRSTREAGIPEPADVLGCVPQREAPRLHRNLGPELPDELAQPGSRPGRAPASYDRVVGPARPVRPLRLRGCPRRGGSGGSDGRREQARGRGRAVGARRQGGGAGIGERSPAGPRHAGQGRRRRSACRHRHRPRDELPLDVDCAHIANATMRERIETVCRREGFNPPVICTPEELTTQEDS